MSEEIQIFNFPQDFSIEVFHKQLKFSMSPTDLILNPPSFPLFTWKLEPPPVFFISGDDDKLMYPDIQIRNLGDIIDPTFFLMPHIHLVIKSCWLVVPLEFVSSSPLVQAPKSKSDLSKILKWPSSLPYLNSSRGPPALSTKYMKYKALFHYSPHPTSELCQKALKYWLMEWKMNKDFNSL